MAKIEEDERIEAAKSESPVFDKLEEGREMLAKPAKVPDNLSGVTDRALSKQHSLEALNTACEESGGPAQWLLRHFPTKKTGRHSELD